MIIFGETLPIVLLLINQPTPLEKCHEKNISIFICSVNTYRVF